MVAQSVLERYIPVSEPIDEIFAVTTRHTVSRRANSPETIAIQANPLFEPGRCRPLWFMIASYHHGGLSQVRVGVTKNLNGPREQ
jgi:hypothetical protein